MTGKRIDLARGFLARQKALSATLKIPLEFTRHPTALGDASEADWAEMLRSFLPGRYEVGPAFAVDHTGASSLQLDLAIYDRQYSPLWFESGGHRYVPAESVYAVLEAKQEVNAKHLGHAADKVASVRALQRTSAHIVDIYGVHPGASLDARPILGGIVALRSGWKGGLNSAAGRSQVERHADDRHLDLGLALLDGAFSQVPEGVPPDLLTPGYTTSQPGSQLAFFTFELFRRLQAIGTAPAVDLNKYLAALDGVSAYDYTEDDLA